MANERILLVQLADIGDLVLTTPAIAALREARPLARIDLLASERMLCPSCQMVWLTARFPFIAGRAAPVAEFFAWRNLRILVGLWSRKYDTIVFFHHFTLRAGVFQVLAIGEGERRPADHWVEEPQRWLPHRLGRR